MATYHLKEDISKGYYWVLQSSENYKIVAMSSEAYSSKQGAIETPSIGREQTQTKQDIKTIQNFKLAL